MALFNRSPRPEDLVASWPALGLAGRFAVRDVWEAADLGVHADSVAARVPAKGVKLLVLSPAPPY